MKEDASQLPKIPAPLPAMGPPPIEPMPVHTKESDAALDALIKSSAAEAGIDLTGGKGDYDRNQNDTNLIPSANLRDIPGFENATAPIEVKYTNEILTVLREIAEYTKQIQEWIIVQKGTNG